VTWIAPGAERSADYPARRNEPEREMLRDWLDWHRATLLRKCAGLDATRLAKRAVPPSGLSLLGLVRHMSDTERGWVRQTFRGEQVPDLYYRPDAPDADFEEADPAGAEEDFERYQAECRAVDAALVRLRTARDTGFPYYRGCTARRMEEVARCPRNRRHLLSWIRTT
jgi:Protein of unknown function (DUF664)